MAIYRTREAVGATDAVALVVADDESTIVYGTSDVADDLREAVIDVGHVSPDDRLKLLAHGLSYYQCQGPYHTWSKTTDVAILAKAYGLS